MGCGQTLYSVTKTCFRERNICYIKFYNRFLCVALKIVSEINKPEIVVKENKLGTLHMS
jgi:hypothetical protein